MKRDEIDRWVRSELEHSRREQAGAEQAMLAFVFFCGVVGLVVVIAELLR